MQDTWGGLVDLALPRACGGCGGAGHRWCPDCLEALAGELVKGVVVGHLEGMPLWAGGDYTGALRSLVRGYKDGERRDLRPLMACAAQPALAACLASLGGRRRVVVVPAPSRPRTRRARGDDPVADLARSTVARWCREGPWVAPAGRGAEPCLPVVTALRARGVGSDQSGLTRAQRRRNLTGRVQVRSDALDPEEVEGAVLLDDVITTGATLAAGRAALEHAGVRVLGAVTCARVP